MWQRASPPRGHRIALTPPPLRWPFARVVLQLGVANVEVRRGILLLTPQSVTPYGGSVPAFADRLDPRTHLRSLLKYVAAAPPRPFPPVLSD